MPESDDETWAPVPGYEGLYEVSDQGRVRSLERMTDNGQGEGIVPRGGNEIAQHRPHSPTVVLCRDGNTNHRSLARLLLLAHEGPPPDPTLVAVREDDSKPPTLDNLSWGRPIGQQKLDEAQALSIWREAWAAERDPDTTHKDIAARYGISRQTVSHIKNGRNWSHATPSTPPASDDK